MFEFLKRNVEVPSQKTVIDEVVVSEKKIEKKTKNENTLYFKMWHPMFFKGNIKLVGSDNIFEYSGGIYFAIYSGVKYSQIIATDEFYRNIDFSQVHLFHLLSKSPTLKDNEKKFINDLIKNLNGTWFHGHNGKFDSLTYENNKRYRVNYEKPKRDANGKFAKKD